MKKQNLRIFVIFAVLAILSISTASAQSANEQTAQIPFAFNVADKTFPAGEYRVWRVNPQSSQGVLAIRSLDGRAGTITLTTDVQGNRVTDRAKLIFKRYGDEYYLSQVWTPADATGLALPKSRSERTLAKRMGNQKPEQQTVALSARKR